MSLATASNPRATDQAAGLRRMFGSARKRFVALAHNAEVVQSTLVIDRLCDAAAALGLHTLVVDAADSAPAPHEMALLDLPSCVEPLSDDVSYLAARGLPIRHVDSQGRCAGFL
ncbi:MAG TPA: flagellar biosynthesis protein, partial [Burkholderiaceae bacterium]|nr:flagellar biosynthesis protein [Burkholderiaceae bacterium]